MARLHDYWPQLDALGQKVGSLREDGDRILAALDELFSRAWS
jgi:hypothetical protein